MARLVLATLLGVQLLISLSFACFSIPTSNSGRPFGVDINDNTEVYPYYENGNVGVGFEMRFRRRRDVGSATLDEVKSRELFQLLDLNKDGQLDGTEWFAEGGDVPEFDALVIDHDSNGDGAISLKEFLQVPVLPGLALHVAPPVPAGEPRED